MSFLPKKELLVFVIIMACFNIIFAKNNSNLIILAAQKAEYDSKNNIISLNGRVRVAHSTEILEADSITYDVKNNKIFAKGNVILYRPDGSRLNTDSFEITADFKKGIAKELTALLTKKSRLSGRKIDYNISEKTTIDKAIYSLCENCKSDDKAALVWQIRAKQCIYDHQNEHISYTNASVEIKGVPVMYTPYFSHPSPKKKKCSGLLFPKFGQSSDLGTMFLPSYLWVFESKEVILSPIITSKAGIGIWGRYAQRLRYGQAKLDLSLATSHSSKSNRQELSLSEIEEISRVKSRGWRGHALGYIQKDVNDNFRLFGNLDWVSDKTYLTKYNVIRKNTPSILESNVGGEFFKDRSYATIKTASYQNLSIQDAETAHIPVVLPFGYSSIVFSPPKVGGSLETTVFTTQMLYPESYLERRMFLSTKWSKRFLITNGHDINIQIGAMADGYGVSSSFNKKYKDLNIISNDNSVSRTSPKGSIFWRWPLLATHDNLSCIIEPTVGGVFTPVMQKKYAEMLNASSSLAKSFELNDVNYSSPSYYNSISDYMDNGSRAVYGFNTTSYYQGKKILRATIGQNYNMSAPQLNLPYASGVRHRWSNIVGSFETYPTERSRLYYRYSYNPRNNTLIKQETGITSTVFKDTQLSLDAFSGQHYALINNKQRYKGYRASIETPIAGYWRGNGGLVVGENYKTLNYNIGAKYEDECFIFNTWVERNAYIINDVKPSTNFMFSVELKTIGHF